MRIWQLALVCLLVGVVCRAAAVYKWIDADGVVHYSDQPTPGAEKIQTGTSSGRTGPSTTAPAAAKPVEKPKKRGSALDYDEFAIISPTQNQTFFGDTAVTVRLNLVPELRPNQAITWNLNGKVLDDQASDATLFTLDNLPRGSYSLAATIVDQTTGESASAETVSFVVQQHSVLSPLRKKPAG
jgi:hypothetical protein